MLLPYYDSAQPSTHLTAGDPLDGATLIGPLHTPGAVATYEKTLEDIKSRGGQVLTKRSGRMDVSWAEGKGGNWVWPVVVRPKEGDPCWKEECFAPILQVAEFDTLEEAIA